MPIERLTAPEIDSDLGVDELRVLLRLMVDKLNEAIAKINAEHS